ncbi:protein-tyrosine phosphatase [Terribacillus halophilus]|uniref:Protein-tyrosine phosphatase n=1 Tax=Terribacillus halophilus TaxID=361279 RepID=A0A1G6PVG4_9BACI|nr:tyrosine-protein phosphatase [Terribacillus halophilus]SDC84038.1 protein-tyrosine phosphatase [Terribacillus halophilus]
MKERKYIYQFDKLYNFRDIGGLQTKDGRMMRTGLLFRSEELSQLSANDIEKFHRLNIKSICDLRTFTEQKSKISRINSNVKILNVSIHDKSRAFTRFEFFKFLVTKSNTINFEDIMKDMYKHMASETYKEINQIITFLSEQRNLPALIHCTGGKDRTGFITAIIQLFAGVPYETVMDDYLFSNQLIAVPMKKKERYIQWMSLFRISPESIKPILEVRREYLEEACNKILNQYGDIDRYLKSACKIPEDNLIKLKQLLTE